MTTGSCYDIVLFLLCERSISFQDIDVEFLEFISYIKIAVSWKWMLIQNGIITSKVRLNFPFFILNNLHNFTITSL